MAGLMRLGPSARIINRLMCPISRRVEVKRIMIIGIVCMIAAGCDSNHGNGVGGRTLAGTKWRLTAWSVSSLDSSQFTITADFDDSQISGTSAVNSYGGT